jgi:uncharacterized membrane protein YdjX (TVP38/TMEM64 family)
MSPTTPATTMRAAPADAARPEPADAGSPTPADAAIGRGRPGTGRPPGAPTGPGGRRRRIRRLAALAVGVAGLAAGAASLPLHTLPDAVATLGPAAAVAAAGAGALLLAVMVPRTAISLACGALLGPLLGATAALAAAMLAAAGTYAAGRWAGRGALSAAGAHGAGRWLGSRLNRLDAWLNRRGLSAVLLVRFLPLAPFGLIGYAYGTTSVRHHHYLLGTLIAALPSTFSYAFIGAAVVAPGRVSWLTFVPAAIGFTLSTGIVVHWRMTGRRTPAATCS